VRARKHKHAGILYTYIYTIYINIYKTSFGALIFLVVIVQFDITIATNCRVLSLFMKVSFAVGHERAGSFLFQCVVPTENRTYNKCLIDIQ
jgi:hypothetical protein